MIFGWIIGLVISLVCLIISPDESIKGLLLISIGYFTIGLVVDCYKAQNRLPQESYQKKLRELAKVCSEENIEIRKHLLKHIKYMQELNTLCGQISQDHEGLKKSILELADILDSLSTTEEDSDNIKNMEGTVNTNEKL